MEPSPVESAGGLRKYSRILGGAGGDSGDSVGRGGVETNQKRSEPNLCTSERSARTSEREEEAPAPMNEPFAPENEQKRTEPRLTWIGAVGGGGAAIVQATTILISSISPAKLMSPSSPATMISRSRSPPATPSTVSRSPPVLGVGNVTICSSIRFLCPVVKQTFHCVPGLK